MSITVFGIVLFGAVLHATWNAIVKGAGDKLLTTILITVWAGLAAAAILPFLAQPAAASWPFIATSVVLQILYFVLVVGAYRAADLSQTYPLMRGTAPLLVAMASAVMFGENLSMTAWAGICLISFGIVSLTLWARQGGRMSGVGLALLNAVVIAAYTLIDGFGVRRSGAPIAYTMWLSLLWALPLLLWGVVAKGAAFARYARKHLFLGLVGAIGMMASYGFALWAMTEAPVALVAALRETSILWATAIAALVLKEEVGRGRIAAVSVIALGAAVLRLA